MTIYNFFININQFYFCFLLTIFTNIFGHHRQFSDQRHLFWIKVFSSDFTKHINICPPNIYDQIHVINLRVYTRKEIYDIHDGDSPDNETFLVSLFQLNAPINPDFWYFASIFTENHREIKENPNLWSLLTSILFRLLIQFDYQFYKSYEQILTNAANDLLFINSHLIYPLIYSFPPSSVDTGLDIVSHFTSAVSHIFNKPNIALSQSSTVTISNAILYGCFNLFSSSDHPISKIHFPILRLFLIYFSSNLPLIGTNIINSDVLQNINKITSLFLQISPNLLINDSFNITNQFLICSSQFLDKFGTETFTQSHLQILFEIGTNIIKVISFISQVNLNSKTKISKEIHTNSLIIFILWTLDSFPLTDFKFHEELHQNHSGIIPKQNWSDADIEMKYEFIEEETFKESPLLINNSSNNSDAQLIQTTFSTNKENDENIDFDTDETSNEIDIIKESENQKQDLKSNEFLIKNVDGKEIQLRFDYQYPFSINRDDFGDETFSLPKYFKDQHTTLITAVRFFLDQMNDTKINFINDFISTYFSIFSQIKNNDSTLCTKFKVEDHCLILSFPFFMIILFSQFKSDTIFEIISSHPNGWTSLFNNLFFSPLINHWVDPTPYFQFIFDIRSSITKLILRCFNLTREENNSLFSCLHNFFYSVEPQIFDEAINIFSQLFKLKPIEFVENASQTGIIEMFLFNSGKLQKLHIQFIKTNNKMMKFVKQTRIHLFNFFDLFLLESCSTEYFFKNEFFIKYLISLLFEKSISLFAIKLIQRGMLLPDTLEVFKAVHFLFQMCLKNLNDMNWIKMLNLFLVNIRSPFILNRSAIMQNLIDKEILLQISQMPDSVILSNPSFFHIQIKLQSTQSLDKYNASENNTKIDSTESIETELAANLTNQENESTENNNNTDNIDKKEIDSTENNNNNDDENDKNDIDLTENTKNNNNNTDNNDKKEIESTENNNDTDDNDKKEIDSTENNINNDNDKIEIDDKKNIDNNEVVIDDNKNIDGIKSNDNGDGVVVKSKLNEKDKKMNAVDLLSSLYKADKNIDPNSEQVQVIRNVLFIIIILSRGSQSNSSYISSNDPISSNLSKSLSRFKYGPEILNLLLELIFEKQMNVSNLPKKAEIQNHYMLPFFFNSTKHLEIHGLLMRYFSDVLSDSISNRLRVYQANIPNIIIDRITQFPVEPIIGSYLEQSLRESLHLFSVVSQYVFSVSTLYKCIRSFKPIESDKQMWWTAQLISLFNIYIENSFDSSPAAFFYLDGFQTYFEIPSFSCNLIYKGFTFVCRIQLDSTRSRKSAQSTLLYMESVSGFVFEIVFVKMKMKIMFYTKDKTYNKSYKINTITFSGNKWYDIIVTFSKSNMTIFMNGKQVFCLEMKYPFKNDIKHSIIANNKEKDSPLIANISCFYFLNDSINSWTALEFHSLPLDFVFGFSTLEKLLDPNLPISLFDGRIESTLFIGANARMTNQKECFNFATHNSIGNAKYKGYAFPFSVSFIDVVSYSGGTKLFLPLFEQINSKIYGSENSLANNSSFLQNLISLFSTFFVHSASIENEFVKDGGFHAFSSLITKINPKYVDPAVLQEMLNLWIIINQRHNEVMLKTIWFNFLLWDSLSIESQIFFYSKVFLNIVESKVAIVSANLSITEFLTVIARQKVDKIRYLMWPSLLTLARNSFTEKDQDSLFSACFYTNSESKSILFQIEALNILFILVSEKVHNCHLLFLRNASFHPFLQLIHSPFEDIRILGLRFLFLIDSFDEYKEIKFNKYVYRACVEIDSTNMTINTLNSLISLSFDTNKLLPSIKFILPLFCAYSHYYQKEEIDMISNKLLNAPNFFLIAKCKNWIFWIFYMINQLSLPFNSNHSLFKLIENLCTYLALNEKYKKFNLSMAFIRSMLFQMSMDMTTLIRNILTTIMKSIINNFDSNNNELNNISPNLFNLLIQEVIFYLFFISKNESYSFNVQLLAKYDVQVYESVQLNFDGHQNLMKFVGMFNDLEFSPFVLSARINAKGEWIDMNLALTFLDFLCLYTADKVPVQLPFQKIRTEEIFAYVASFAIRSDRENEGLQIRNIISKINKFFDGKEILDSARKIIVCFLSNIVCKSSKNINNNNNEDDAVVDNKNNEIMNSSNNVKKDNENIPFVIVGLQFNQEQRLSDHLYKWLDIFESLNLRYFEDSRNTISVLWTRLTPMFSSILRVMNDEFDYSLLFESQITRNLSKQKRHMLILDKITSRLLSKMKANGGPWDDKNGAIHWKYWRRTDKFYRHILMKPNTKFFDRHDKAAMRRDNSSLQDSPLQGESLIESQLLSKQSLLTKSLLEIDIDNFDDDVDENNNNKKGENSTNQIIISNFDADAKMITISGIYEGTFFISKKQILFTGDKISDDFGITLEESNSKAKVKTVQLDLDNLIWVLHRSYVHIDQGLEFFLNNGLSYFFFFSSQKVRQKIIQFISSSKKNEVLLQDCNSMKFVSDQKITEKWMNGFISTYEYIMLINFFAGRSFNDLSQYPIFPWILADYESSTLDLKNKKSFRDLSKPIGALNDERLIKLKREYEELPDGPSKCLYRGHYSTSYNVIHFMLRVEPFTTLHVQVQRGKFDFPSRLFTSIPKSYATCKSTANDYRELIPEFFSLPDFLVNKNGFNLGIDDGNDVKLPNWASSPSDFILKHREALESEFVGQHINEWIDLVFGYKQKGKNAVDSDNTFHAYCYEDSINKKVLKDKELLLEIQQHAGSFGIIPRQVFAKKHPQRQQISLMTSSYVKVPAFSYQMSFNSIFSVEQKENQNNQNRFDSFSKSALNEVVALKMIGNEIFILTSNRNFLVLGANDKLESGHYGLIANIRVPFYFEQRDNRRMTHNIACIFKQFGVLVAISAPEDSFHAYSIADNFLFKHIFSFRQKYSSLTSISAADDNTLILLSQDGTINVWCFIKKAGSIMNSGITGAGNNSISNTANNNSNNNIGNGTSSKGGALTGENGIDAGSGINSVDKCPADFEFNYNGKDFRIIQKFRRNHHFITTKDAFGNGNLGLIASCDVNKRIILTDLNNGSFLRSWFINGKSLFPQRVMILDSGFIAALCETGSQNAKRTVIQCFTIDAEISGAYDHFGLALAWIPLNFRNGTSFIAVSFEDCTLLVLHVPDLKTMTEIKFPSVITRISFNKENNSLLLSNAQGKILTTNL